MTGWKDEEWQNKAKRKQSIKRRVAELSLDEARLILAIRIIGKGNEWLF